jgi:hypothetical protein
VLGGAGVVVGDGLATVVARDARAEQLAEVVSEHYASAVA